MEETDNIIESVTADDVFCDDAAVIAARERFGIRYLFPWQRLVIANIVDSYEALRGGMQVAQEDADDVYCNGRQIVLLPTGAGKSACFQIPALLLDGATLVIYPLLALMSDQFRRLSDAGIECAVLRGGQSPDEREGEFGKIARGAKIIIANPEVLGNSRLLERLRTFSIAHIAIDEAHCVSEWGDSFRPAYLELGGIIERLGAPIVTAFTATASPEVLARVSEVLFGGRAHIVRSGSDRPNINYYVRQTDAKCTAALFLSRTQMRPMIIFCGTRGSAENMARAICTAFGDGAARFYHAGLEKEEKADIEQWFFRSEDGVLCATCAYGMGVDKKNIRTVIHLEPPATAEAYIQEAGRGGRDGNPANAILLWSSEDSRKFKQMPNGSRGAVMRTFARSSDCRRQTLLDALGAEKTVCSGCDICDAAARRRTGRRLTIPGEELPDCAGIVLRHIRRAKRYFTERTLEDVCLAELNGISRRSVGIHLWNHADFKQIFDGLLFYNKIQVMKFPWSERLSPVKKFCRQKKNSVILHRYFRLLHFLRRFVPAGAAARRAFSFSDASAFFHSLLRKCRNLYTGKQRRL